MVKITVEYQDFDGNSVNKDLYFNLNRRELMDLNDVKIDGLKFQEAVKAAEKSQDVVELFKVVDVIIDKSYGERSEDGKRFLKIASDGVTPLYKIFRSSLEFDALYDYLLKDPMNVVTFILNTVNRINDESIQNVIHKIQEDIDNNKINYDNMKEEIDRLSKAVENTEATSNLNTVSDNNELTAPYES